MIHGKNQKSLCMSDHNKQQTAFRSLPCRDNPILEQVTHTFLRDAKHTHHGEIHVLFSLHVDPRDRTEGEKQAYYSSALDQVMMFALVDTLVFLLGNRQTNALALRQRHPFGFTFANDEYVRNACGKFVASDILQVNNVEAAWMTITVSNDADATQVVATGDHGGVADGELGEGLDLAGLEIEFDGVVDANVWVRVADSATVVCNNVRHGTSLAVLEWVLAKCGEFALGEALHAAQFELGVVLYDTVQDKATLDIVQQAEVLAGLLNGDNVHEAGWVVHVAANLVIDLNLAIHDNHLTFSACKTVFETVAQQHQKGDALAKFVRASGWARGPDATKFAEHPMLWGIEPLHVLLRSARHGDELRG